MERPAREYEISIRQLLQILLRNKWMLLGVFLVCVVVAYVGTRMMDPVYSATAEIMVREGGTDLLTNLVSGEIGLAGLGGASDVDKHKPWIRSTATLEKAIAFLAEGRRPGTAEKDSTARPVRLSPDELRDRFSVRSSTASGLIEVVGESGDPLVARSIADAVVMAYMEVDRERANASVSTVRAFLEDQISVVETALSDLESEVVAFQERTGLLLQESLITSQLSRVEQLLVEAEVEIKDRQSELDSIEKLLEEVTRELLTRVTSDSEGTPLLLELRDKTNYLLRLQNEIADLERDRLASIREESYAEAKIYEAQILEKKRELEDDARQQFTVLDMLPEYEELIARQLQVNLEIEALTNRVSILRAMRDEQKASLLSHALELARHQRELDVGQSVYQVLLDEYQGALIMEAAQIGTIEVVNWAETPTAPIRPRRLFNLVVGGFLGILLGLGGVALREGLVSTVRSRDELELSFPELPLLGTIPEIRHPASKMRFAEVKELLLPHLGRTGIEFQAFSTVEANLRFVSPDSPIQTLAITSSTPNEGKSTVAANLALTMLHNGRKTVLVDADFRKPILEQVFGLGRNLSGLAEVISGQRTLEECTLSFAYEGFGELAFVPAGRDLPNPLEIISSARFSETLGSLCENYDIVILDMPPVGVGPDARILGTMADGVLLVVRASKTRRDQIRHSIRALQQAQSRILGAILNRASLKRSDNYAYYAYYATEDEKPRKRRWPWQRSSRNGS